MPPVLTSGKLWDRLTIKPNAAYVDFLRAGVLGANDKKKHIVFTTDWAVGANTYKYSLFLISLVNNAEWPQSSARKQNEVTVP